MPGPPPPPPQGQGFLAKSGLDSINIGGHKVPIALIGGVAALAGVFLVLRARKSGSNVVGAGNPANTGANPVIDYTAQTTPDYSAALSNLQGTLTGLEQSLTAQQTPAPVTTPTAPPNVEVGTIIPASGDAWAVWNRGRGIPVWSETKAGQIIGWAPYGSQIEILKPEAAPIGSDTTGYQVSYGGGKGYVVGTEIGGTSLVPLSSSVIV